MMLDFQADYQDCVDNDWTDLINTYWNIVRTSHGDIQLNALRSLRDEVTRRLLQLPPSEEEVTAHNPAMQLSED